MRAFKPVVIWMAMSLLLMLGGTWACAQDGRADIATPDYGSGFWENWGDGRAELNGYTLVFPRYGELRKGSAVTIFVTEPFSNRVRVKADPGNHPEQDVFPVMKLNLVQDFSTGIYDYNLMTSAFVALEPVNQQPRGALTKVGFSSQEWCGLLHAQYVFNPDAVDYTLHSYFDSEADQRKNLPLDHAAFSEDGLLIWARGLMLPIVQPGEQKKQPMLMGLQTSRLEHESPKWQEVTLSRSDATEKITVPAGEFEVRKATAAIEAGRTWTFEVETAPPHRIIRWSTSDGQVAEMTGSERLKYWQMNGNADDKAVEQLGLPVREDDSM